MKRKTTYVAAIVTLLVPPGTVAQTTAREVTKEEASRIEQDKHAGDQEMKSPMLLEVTLAAKDGTPVLSRVPASSTTRIIYSTSETKHFVTDRARVSMVMVERGKTKKGKTPYKFKGFFESEWFRQDLDVTMTLVDADGTKIAHRFWDDETLGNNVGVGFAGHSKWLELEAVLDDATVARLTADSGRPAKLSVLVEVQSNDED